MSTIFRYMVTVEAENIADAENMMSRLFFLPEDLSDLVTTKLEDPVDGLVNIIEFSQGLNQALADVVVDYQLMP